MVKEDLKPLFCSIRDTYQQSLFDPVQTHAIYGLTKDTLPEAKRQLKEQGATRFRVVTTRHGFKILCYKSKRTPV